jgi:hypothetical protein
LLTVRVGVPKGKAVTTVSNNANLVESVSVAVDSDDVDEPAYPEVAVSSECSNRSRLTDHDR